MKAGLVRARWAVLNKLDTLETYDRELQAGRAHIESALIVASVRLTAADWEAFSAGLLNKRPYLVGRGGTKTTEKGPWDEDLPIGTWTHEELERFRKGAYRLVVEVIGPDRFVYVDPQGYDYARYIGLPLEKTPTDVQPLALPPSSPTAPEPPREGPATQELRRNLAAQKTALERLQALTRDARDDPDW